MLILKIAAGEGAIKADGVGDIHVAMLATNQYRVYVNGGTLPDGSDDAHFDGVADACRHAFETAQATVEETVAENGADPYGNRVHASGSKGGKGRK